MELSNPSARGQKRQDMAKLVLERPALEKSHETTAWE